MDNKMPFNRECCFQVNFRRFLGSNRPSVDQPLSERSCPKTVTANHFPIGITNFPKITNFPIGTRTLPMSYCSTKVVFGKNDILVQTNRFFDRMSAKIRPKD